MTQNALLYVFLMVARRIVPVVPLRVTYALAAVVGTAAYYVLPQSRRNAAANLAQVLGVRPDSSAAARVARQVFRNDARSWVDTIRLHRLTQQQILESVPVVEGWHNIETAVRRGNGLILVCMHLGNLDLVGQVLLARGFRLTVPVERVEPKKLFDLLQRERQSKGIRTVPVDRAAPALVRALRAGEIIAVVGDRRIAGRSAPAEVFGRRTELAVGALSLARRTGAPVIVGVGVRVGPGKYRGYATPPLPLVQTADANRDQEENVRILARAMEAMIARFPDQWMMFAPFWPPGDGEREAATIGHPTEAAV